jgi:uncharacterized iron-regulated protein
LVIVLAGSVSAGELDLLPLGDPERAFVLGSAAAGSFYDTRAGQEVSFDEMVEQLARARVVLLGEEHTSMEQKLVHARVLEALAARGLELKLGMEFFLREHNQVLAQWVAGELDEEEMLDAGGWYDRGSYRYDLYRPIMDVAHSHGIPVIGLNVPREIARAINRGGLDNLSEEQRAEIGEISTSGSPQHRYLISRYFGETVAMLPPAWFANMYTAQSMWDVVMARSILDHLEPETTIVVVVGSGHVAYGLGIPRRISEELASRGAEQIPVATFCPVEAPLPDTDDEPAGHPMGGMGGGGGPSPAQFASSLADFVAVFASTGGIEPFPRLGLSLEEADDSIVVSMVLPDTLAQQAGFTGGDQVIDINGSTLTDLSHLRRLLARLEWGQRLDLRVERDGEMLDIAVLLYPEVASSESTLAPGWKVTPVDLPDAISKVPVQAPARAAAELHAVLLHHDGQPHRVEVPSQEALEEVHELDANARIVRSLYRTPRRDEAVEILYQRGDDGSVTAMSRFDRTGSRR